MYFRIHAHTDTEKSYVFVTDEFEANDLNEAIAEMRRLVKDYGIYDCSLSVDIAFMMNQDAAVDFDELHSSMSKLVQPPKAEKEEA